MLTLLPRSLSPLSRLLPLHSCTLSLRSSRLTATITHTSTSMSQKSIRSYFTPSKRPLRDTQAVTPNSDMSPAKRTRSQMAVTDDTGDGKHSTINRKVMKEDEDAPSSPQDSIQLPAIDKSTRLDTGEKETAKQSDSSSTNESGAGGDGSGSSTEKINEASGDKSGNFLSSNTSISLGNKIKALSSKFVALSPNIGHSWFRALEPEFNKKYFATLSSFLATERRTHTIYPPTDEVYSWTTFCDIKDVKVVILGQDPYHGPNQAHGLCFSVKKGVATPPSLMNMYKELQSDIKNFKPPFHGNLIGWAKQGVLLLNACLTVRASNANSHASRGWENLTDAVIKYLNENNSNLVFILWGSYAQKKGDLINSSRHLVLKSAHPSPLSASRGFFGCRHFSKANNYLQEKGKTPIDWCDLP